MMSLYIVLGVFGGVILTLILAKSTNKIRKRRCVKKYASDKHHCNRCEKSYIFSVAESKYRYCPYCGTELEWFCDLDKDAIITTRCDGFDMHGDCRQDLNHNT